MGTIARFVSGLIAAPRFSLAFAAQVLALAGLIGYYFLWAELATLDSVVGKALSAALVVGIVFWLPLLVALIKLGRARPIPLVASCAMAGLAVGLLASPLYPQYRSIEVLAHVAIGALLGALFCVVAFWRPNRPMQPSANAAADRER